MLTPEGNPSAGMVRVVRLLVVATVAFGVLVTAALVVGGCSLKQSHDTASDARELARDQRALRHDALVQSCEARNGQNAGVVGFLASVSRGKQTFDQVARDPRVTPYFPIHGRPLPDGKASPETHAYCVRYADSLS